MRTKLFMLFVVLLGLTVVLGACSAKNNTGKEAASAADVQNKSNAPKDAKTKEIIKISVGEDDYGARMSNYTAAFKALNEELTAQGKNVEVVADILPAVGDDELVLQAQAGQYRDISMNSSLDIGWELDAGLIQPIDWLKESEVFKTLPQNLWDIMEYQGHVYGAIQDMDASPLYINKTALKTLGWSDADIEGLPDRVLKGDWTMDDMLNVAAEAVKKKVTKYGLVSDGLDNISVQDINNQMMGFEPYDQEQSKVIFDKKGITDTYSFWEKGIKSGAITKDFAALEDVGFGYYVNGDVMFFIGGTGSYNSMKEAYGKTDKEFEDWFYANSTFTLIPAGSKGGEPGSLANPRLYYVSSKVDEQKMPYVQRIIELAMAPNLQMDHTIASGKLPVTKSGQEDPRFSDLRFLHDVAYMLDYTKVRPPHLAYPDYLKQQIKGLEAIMVNGASAAEAYKLFEENYKQNVDQDQVIFR
ncbi:hypothetical protein H70357_07675 [Paenibacillus sp. FSL H7-0357]|uniref:hypothetical protein n=1 Tax=Paenibacillus sp. FSL H7-0357 TaxID=1536774 RepID=UPI0004F7394C|nr:hypothetical protein [Paenibacillus sp. FSL H7-0357]AIQ16570.1 hypothetical protein H70357_07675 [Paenibacillus sp. FSL H7-0357]